MKIKNRLDQTGFAMLEVLASVMILAFCLLSIAGLLVFTQRSNTSSYVKQQAIQSAYDILDLMQSNRDTAVNGNYAFNNLGGAVPAVPAIDCSATTCTPTQLATYDLYQWALRMSQYGGSGSIVMAAPAGLPSSSTVGAVAQITVQWDDSPAQSVLGRSTANPNAALANLEQVIITSQLSYIPP